VVAFASQTTSWDTTRAFAGEDMDRCNRNRSAIKLDRITLFD